MEKFAKFKKDVSSMDGDSITWYKDEYYYVIDEKENMYCIDQFDYLTTKCWMGKDCEGDLFDIVEYPKKG